MFQTIEKAMLAGIGAAYMAKERIEELGQKLAKEADVSESEGRRLVEELVKKSEDARAALEKLVGDRIDATMNRLDIPSREEVNELKQRVAELEQQAKAEDT